MITEAILSITIRFYRLLVRLYPRQFREQFGEEMTAVYAQRARQAAANGGRALLTIWLRELWDWPISCLRAHWLEQHIEGPVRYRWPRRVAVLVGLLVLGVFVYQSAAVWLEYKLMYPPEQATCRATSLDGSETAILSVKYEGERKWLPQNPMPHYYITIIDKNGRTLLRETDYEWPPTTTYPSMTDSFTRLREEYAPWMEEVTVNCGLPGSINASN
ncbi:MAG: hypothetical protein IPM53_03725 [Anaerolineaceae bacterium]|nr:hypothetical protein [Anaerolineaceae bacterium]